MLPIIGCASFVSCLETHEGLQHISSDGPVSCKRYENGFLKKECEEFKMQYIQSLQRYVYKLIINKSISATYSFQ